jgi:transaldolase/glucose-6-phosphate isomerase
MSVAAVNERLAALTAAGTSVWLDQIRRGMIESGELGRMVEQDSLRGVTSNPAIFEKAILGSDDYDDELRDLTNEGLDAVGIYRRIAVKDVQMACDVLRPVYDETDGYDGYVSLEVAPDLARDPERTLAEAREYWQLVDRPNLMIKIPGTPEGLSAIEEALYDGINVNVTLLFAVSAYEGVMEAFIRAMERRHAEGKPLDRHGVASFFVSRVDSEIDKRLDALGRTDLAGRAGLANARAAYAAFKRVFGGERFEALRAAGCPAQRPLWASTGVKNPAYSDTMYVDGLVAPETVNTMPLDTLLAAADHADITGEATADIDPTPDLEALREAGIDLDDVTDKLLRDGIELFVVAMDKLVDGIERKREAIATGRPETIDTDLPDDLERAVVERLRRAREEDVVHRLWHLDETLWAPKGTPELADRLGWLSAPENMSEEAGALKEFAAALRAEGYTDAVLLGMGGSSLAPEVMRQSFGVRSDGLRLHVLDSTEPLQIRAVEQAIDVEKTVFVVSSKSGGTIEVMSLFEHFHALQPDGSHFVAVTDPGTSLQQLASDQGFRRVFCADPHVGGRYSALTHFGLVPAALMGVDVEALLENAQIAEQSCQSFEPEHNAGLWMGIVLGEAARAGRDKLTMIVDPPLESFGLWAEQLIAESTGKQGKGILPVADEPIVEPSHYGDDRIFVYVRTEEGLHDEAVRALSQTGQPVITLQATGPEDLGRIFFLSQFATAVAGWVLEINPFDQPNVQEAKENTIKALESATEVDPGTLELGGAQYLAILGFLPYSEEVDAAVGRLRKRVLSAHRIATTFGYGPRYLHSTGQYHKGGPATGAFLQLTHDADDDVEIPGEGYTFRRLIRAQADGDLLTLRAHGRRAARVELPAADLAAAIDRLEV